MEGSRDILYRFIVVFESYNNVFIVNITIEKIKKKSIFIKSLSFKLI